MSGATAARASMRPEAAAASPRPRIVAVRALSYATNHVVNRLPSHRLRRGWYRRVLGADLDDDASIHLGARIWFYGPRQVRRDGFALGARAVVNRDCCLDVRGGLRIGADASISPEVTILTAAHDVSDPDFRVVVGPVTVEDHVWIGTRAVILPGTTLGRGCVVSAGAVVTRDVPPLTIVAGVPARTIGKRPEAAARYRLGNTSPLLE